MSRKTVFLTILDADEETIEQLSDTLKSVPEFEENYDFLLGNRLIQTMSPVDLIDSLKHIHNIVEDGDPNNVGITRTRRFRDGMHIMDQYIQESNKLFRQMKQEMDDMLAIFNRHTHYIPNGSTNTEPVSQGIPLFQFDHMFDKLDHLEKRMKKDIAPIEGQML